MSQPLYPVRPPFDPALGDPTKVYPMSDELDLERIRQTNGVFTVDSILERWPHLEHTEHSVLGSEKPDSHSIILSVLQSKNSDNLKRAALYNIHGGGQLSGNRFLGLEVIISYFEENGLDMVYVSVEYRFPPEHPAPAPLHDCYSGLVWVADHATELGVDPSKIIISGTSGGAPMAAGSAILARDRQYPKLYAQMLMTPMLDDRSNSVSSKQFERGTIWSGLANRAAWNLVIGRKDGDEEGEKETDVHETVAPARATDLSNLPPTFIDAGECEVFRDEAVAYASQLWKAGVSAELHIWPGGYHGFDFMVPNAPVSRAAIATKKAWVARILGQKQTL